MSPFQIGAKKGHRAQEHIFVIKSMMNLYEMRKKPLLIQLYDVAKFFDKEHLRDVMSEVYQLGIRGKEYRLLFKMNEKRIIKVITSVGETDETEVKEGIGQGTLDGAITSSAGLGNGVDKFFSSSHWEVSYGSVRLQPLLFVDDI